MQIRIFRLTTTKSVNSSNGHLDSVFLVFVILSLKKCNDCFIYSNRHILAFSKNSEVCDVRQAIAESNALIGRE